VIKDIIGVTRGIEGVLSDLGARVSEHEIRIELSADVLFNFNKSDIRPDASESLKQIVKVIEAYPKSPILIEGHTDSKGTDTYNLKLAEQRALSVKKWIVMHGGIQATRITTKGWGAAKPIAPNTTSDGKDNPAGRQKNRRVEITIKK
jgi:outer membrane protein OmpA-like peptidoglycan-associated protein